MSKGIREAPTKAVMNELALESGDSPDAAYGLRQVSGERAAGAEWSRGCRQMQPTACAR